MTIYFFLKILLKRTYNQLTETLAVKPKGKHLHSLLNVDDRAEGEDSLRPAGPKCTKPFAISPRSGGEGKSCVT